jgi:hypothetical protein
MRLLRESQNGVELHLRRGTFHGSDACIGAPITQEQIASNVRFLERCLFG